MRSLFLFLKSLVLWINKIKKDKLSCGYPLKSIKKPTNVDKKIKLWIKILI
ncbi:hypothetical protein HMPREF3229_00627 [Peptoniphilus harei]|uniref:Uncharacterized protein n=1 Tax=Peptoniphilus harei TaxID=54005 RepID=A0A133PQZ5_9FIRM|nr:hypothetical protein HMPREF3229_00627 [Peptoniphilus harei]